MELIQHPCPKGYRLLLPGETAVAGDLYNAKCNEGDITSPISGFISMEESELKIEEEQPCAYYRKIICPELENNFTYHAPKPGQPEKYTRLRDEAKSLAYTIQELCPDSRERSVAMTKLETAIFWANASIARNE